MDKKEPKYFDMHAHVNFKAFKEDGDEVIRRALAEDTWLANVGSQDTTSKRAIKIAHKYPEGVFAVVGLHPIHLEEAYHDDEEINGEGIHPVVDFGNSASPSTESALPKFTTGFTSRAEVFDHDKYLAMAMDEKVIAIGECGLDYFHLNPDSIEKQKEAFVEQVKLAREVGKPLMLHMRNNPKDNSRNVYEDMAEILKDYPGVKAVSHCFGGSVEDMRRFVSMGIYVSFSGNITYKPRADFDYVSVIKEVPLDMILTDTDSPYLAPVPYRGKRNEPVYVREIVKKIAEIKGLPEDEVANTIIQNAKKLFKI